MVTIRDSAGNVTAAEPLNIVILYMHFMPFLTK